MIAPLGRKIISDSLSRTESLFNVASIRINNY